MIRLTVMYNLPPGSDEEAFLNWRLGEHQASNSSMPGVLRTDFARVDYRWPGQVEPPYRFMTIAEWPDRESFERGFYDAQVQAELQENLKKIHNPLFLISEVMISNEND
ncbi:MAG: hypothetical protein KC519_22460 [Anaerolineae bacterium]|nr:hypothetical protein [Anaerolineae bacterium]